MWAVALVAGIFLSLAGAFTLAGLPEWGFFWLGMLVMVGLGEVYSLRKTGLTLSERFYRLARRSPRWGFLLTALMALGLGLIVYHLWTLWP